MKRIYIASGNQKKFDALLPVLENLLPNVIFKFFLVKIPEIQSSDVKEILMHKVNYVKTITKLPFIVDDMTSKMGWSNNFPGVNTKSALSDIGINSFNKVFKQGDSIIISSHLALSYMNDVEFFSGSIEGTICYEDDHDINNKMPLNDIVYIDKQKKFLGDIKKGSHRFNAIVEMAKYLKELENKTLLEIEQTADRWDKRSSEWENEIKRKDSYVNYENGYERFDLSVEKISKLVDNPSCIDIGCGTGEVSRKLAAINNSNVIGIDISKQMINEASKESQNCKNLSFNATPLEGFQATFRYDIITSRGVVISHMPKKRIIDFLQNVTSLSQEGTYFIFDFIQDIDNGNFSNQGKKNELTFKWVAEIMREFGWVIISKDGSDLSRVVVIIAHRPFKDSIYFATSNPIKVIELKHAANIKHLHICDFDIVEIKRDSIEEIAIDKVKKVFAIIKYPVIGTDGGIFFDAYDGFPGANSKQAAVKLKSDGLLALMKGKNNRLGERKNTIVYFNGKDIKLKTGCIPLEVSFEPRGDYKSYPMDKILIPLHKNNPKKLTYAEFEISQRTQFTELNQFVDFINSIIEQ